MSNAVEFAEPANAASACGRSVSFRHAGRRAAALSSMCLMLAVVAGLCAGAAQAAGELEFNANTTAPGGLAPAAPGGAGPGGTGTMTLSLTNVGDAPVALPSTTITATLPDGIVAKTATGAFSALPTSPAWSCVIAPSGQTVTCTGNPNFTLPAGAIQCNLFGFFNGTCNVMIGIEATTEKALGAVSTHVEACVAGAPPCATKTFVTVIQHFGDQFGIEPINDHPDAIDTVPALEGYEHAFWAGACDRGTAPSVGSPIPAPGMGSRPATLPFIGSGYITAPVPAPAVPEGCIDFGTPGRFQSGFGDAFWAHPPNWRLPALAAAGAHADGTATMAFRRDANRLQIDGAVDNIVVDLPPGFVGNPTAVARCTQDEFAVKPPLCPPESQVGVLQLLIGAVGVGQNHGNASLSTYPVWNLEPRKGKVAELGFGYASGFRVVPVRIAAKPRTSSDMGVTAFVGQIPAALPVVMQSFTLWGVPWAAHNDLWRASLGMRPGDSCASPPDANTNNPYLPPSGLSSACQESYDPAWGPIVPFLSNETDCNPSPVTTMRTDQYLRPGSYTPDGEPVVGDPNWKTYSSPSPAVTDCEDLGFAPNIEFTPQTPAADGPTGLGVDLSIPQNNDPPFDKPAAGASAAEVDEYVDAAAAHWRSVQGRATSHLKDTVVTLPAGVSVNPSAATGLEGCPDATVGVRQQGDPPLFDNVDPTDGIGSPAAGDECPNGSKIGTATVDTPLLDEQLTGDVVLGEPKSTDPQSGEMFRMFLVVRNEERGLLVKVYGSATTDPQTGRITAMFRNNPELPFDNLKLDFKGGSKGVLAMPQRCGSPGWTSAFTPWSSVGAATPVADTVDTGAFSVSENCANAFAPVLSAGMDTQAARSNGTFSFRFSRRDGEQYLRGLTARLPQGLLASVKDLPLCWNSQANAGSCPASSKIGIVDAKAGSGDPFVLEEKGEVFLTEGYKGGAYGLAVKVRPIAGPFRGAMELSPIVVRQAIHVDRKTAQVTAVSDPFPLIHHGVPLRVREVTVLVNRGGFMLNPSDCAAKQVAATLSSDQGATSGLANGFQATGCARLAFKPKLGLRLTGRKQVRTGKHPGIRATVTQKGIPEAGIEKAEVRLPKSLALDVDNAQALCEFDAGTKPDLENHCPKGSIVGRARAVSPLLNDPLVGDVYFVKNVRRSSSGNLIRTLPMIVVALRGEIAVNLVGDSNVKKGKLVNTFDEVPDAPITKFNLNIKGGRNGILAVTRTRRGLINLCAKPRGHIAEADIDGHNGRRYDRDIRMKTPCARKAKKAVCKTKRQKAGRACKAKRRAAKRRAAARRARAR